MGHVQSRSGHRFLRENRFYIDLMPFKRLGSLAAVLVAVTAWAGGSGLNVVVVINQNITNSIQLGNDFCKPRGVLPQNLFRMMDWTGGNVT